MKCVSHFLRRKPGSKGCLLNAADLLRVDLIASALVMAWRQSEVLFCILFLFVSKYLAEPWPIILSWHFSCSEMHWDRVAVKKGAVDPMLNSISTPEAE